MEDVVMLCTQLLKVDDDRQIPPNIELACKQIVDQLVQASHTAANGQC